MSFRAKLGLDTSEFEAAQKRVERAIEPVRKKMKALGDSMSKYVSLPAAGAAAGIAALAVKTAQFADRIDKMSQRLGMSRDSFQQWDFVLSQNGVNIESMQMGMKSLSQRMEEAARGAGQGADMFRRLRVSVTESDGSFRKQEDVFLDTVRALQDMEEGAEKAAMAQRLFGRNGQELLPMLNQSKGSIDELMQSAKDLGLVMDEDAIKAGVRFSDSMDQIQRQIRGATVQIGTYFLPLLQDDFVPFVQGTVVPALQRMAERIGQLVDWWRNLSPPTQRAAIAVGAVVIAAGPAIKIVAGLAGATKMLALGFLALTSPIGIAIVAITAIGVASYALYKNWESVERGAAVMWENIKANFLSGVDAILSTLGKIPGITKVFPTLGYAIDGISASAEKAKDRAREAQEEFERWQEETRNVGDIASRVGDAVKNMFDPSGSGVPEWTEDMKAARKAVEDLGTQLQRIDRIYEGFAGRDRLSKMEEQARALTSVLEDAYAKPEGFRPEVIAAYRAELDELNVTIGEMMNARARAQRETDAEWFDLPGLNEADVRLQGINQSLGITIPRTWETTEAAYALSASLGEDVSRSIGQVVYGTIMMEDGFKSLGDTLRSFGQLAKRVMTGFIADLTVAIARAATLRIISAALGMGNPMGFGAMIMQGMGFQVPSLASGGIAYSPTLAMVGDNRRSPEAIAPLHDLRGFIHDAVASVMPAAGYAMAPAGSMHHSFDSVLLHSGDILLSVRKAERREGRG